MNKLFGVVLVEAIRAPLRDPEWLRKMLAGGALTLLPTLALGLLLAGQVSLPVGVGLLVVGLVLNFVAWGYLFRVFIDALNGAQQAVLPGWRDWKAYGMAGFWLFLILIGYIFIAVVVLSGVLSVLGMIPSGTDQNRLFGLSMLMLLVIVMFYGFFPIVFARFAAEGRVWSAFEPGPVWQDIRQIVKGNYVQACFGCFGFLLMGNLILGLLPLVGFLLASVYWFFLMMVFSRVFGVLIREAKRPPGVF